MSDFSQQFRGIGSQAGNRLIRCINAASLSKMCGRQVPQCVVVPDVHFHRSSTLERDAELVKAECG
jgi:hypothetical protein